MTEIQLTNFKDLAVVESDLVLTWRNHPSVSSWMFTQHEISREEHTRFISGLETRQDCLYFLCKDENEPVGVISLSKITHKSTEMGLYSCPNLRGKGRPLLKKLIEYAFTELKVDFILSRVLAHNLKAKKLYEEFYFMDLESEGPDTIVMRLGREDWQL